MKKILCIVLVSLFSFNYAGDITPTISLKADNVLSSPLTLSPIIGLKVGLADDVSTGFDTHTTDGTSAGSLTASRIYVSKGYGRIGLGAYADAGGGDNGKPYFTFGTTYNATGNLSIDLDYVLNTLATAGDQLQIALTVSF